MGRFVLPRIAVRGSRQGLLSQLPHWGKFNFFFKKKTNSLGLCHLKLIFGCGYVRLDFVWDTRTRILDIVLRSGFQ